ncbi:13374_t:CDS:1, partial [Racocetra persica]
SKYALIKKQDPLEKAKELRRNPERKALQQETFKLAELVRVEKNLKEENIKKYVKIIKEEAIKKKEQLIIKKLLQYIETHIDKVQKQYK